ncbi:hypothetical protein [Allocoleopsis franciscana]|uniref:Uncharacterized protein n=1 Tax=Allocoleopsis franciscana PCC 7113 TaxID=1173027 RepID=K9WQG6_9CYAN|nr:hypothetical protein [Allocoleopsis franciscana]AFZ22034.1 hypothetical protein Mic7113_6454 [Allocoleopsis franciscana PCC 7113]
MKDLKLGYIVLFAATWGLLLTAPINAQAKVTSEPTQLTVTRASDTTRTLTIFLRTTDPITSLQVTPLDLYRTDGVEIVPATAIKPVQPTVPIKANSLLTIPIKFDLSSIPSGEFNGKLLVRYQDDELIIPISLRMKDSWQRPLAVLVLGILLGMLLSSYRSQGRPRDEVLVRVSQLRTQIRTDEVLKEQPKQPFRKRIEEGLVDVEAALQAEQWDKARQAVEQQENVWLKWRKYRSEWLELLSRGVDELQHSLESMPKSSNYTQTVSLNLERAVKDSPSQDNPALFRDELESLRKQINHYLELQHDIGELKDLCNQLPDEPEELSDNQKNHESNIETCQREAQRLEREMNALYPTDENAYKDLEDRVKVAIDKHRELVKPEIATREGSTPISQAPPTPPVGNMSEEELFKKKFSKNLYPGERTRLRLFNWASYLVAVVFLAGAGFNQLYVSQPTFGANPWSDYFTLLAWGFGAEATRESVTKVVRDWGLPGLK